MTFPEWVISGPPVAAPAWCAQFVKAAANSDGVAFFSQIPHRLALTESNHAVFRIETPSLKIRLNVGTNYQGGETLPDGRVLPDLEFWQMNLGIEQFGGGNVNIGGGELAHSLVLGVGDDVSVLHECTCVEPFADIARSQYHRWSRWTVDKSSVNPLLIENSRKLPPC